MAHASVLDAHGHGKLQADLAAALERADRAEVQLRTATEESSRLSDRVELLQHELADAKRDLAKSREETVAVTALAATHGARAVELDREVVTLREKSYQLELDTSAMAAERDRLQSDLAGTHVIIDDMTAARNQLANQLEDAAKQLARSSAAAAAAEDRHKAEMQQLQLRLAASEAEFRALNHAKGTMHEGLQRARGDILALQAQLQAESRQREEQASECGRLERELEAATEALVQSQRSQRGAIATSEQFHEELERLRSAHNALEMDLQIAKERLEKLQEEVRLAAERNTDLAGQVHSLTANLRHLEVENARLTDGHAMLKVEIEARAAEARAARGEAAELAADRARLLAEMQQRPTGDEGEVRRLREALTASRLEIARLQKELAANDAVLADAESALVALVSEKESLQQALSNALMSKRAAFDTADELKSQVAALAVQDTPHTTTVKAVPKRADTLASGNGVDQQRMISYLQSLPDAVATVGPSESGQDQSGATTPAVASPGPGSVTSSMAAVAPASVRVVGTSAPAPTVLRYPAQQTLSTSESESTLPTYRTGGHNDAWEALSASGTENSRKESVSGDGLVASAPAGVPSATSLVVASLSLAMGNPAAQGAVMLAVNGTEPPTSTASTSMSSAYGGTLDAGRAGPAVKSKMPSRRTTSTASNGLQEEGMRVTAAGMGDDTAPPASPRSYSGPSSPTAGFGGSSAAAMTTVGGTAIRTTSAPRSSLLPPRSPHTSAASELHESSDTSNSEPSFGREDMGPRLQPTAGPQSTATQPAGGPSYMATSRPPPPRRPPASASTLPEVSLTPHPEMYRNQPLASFNLAQYQSLPPAAAAPRLPSGGGSPAGSGPTPSGAPEASSSAASAACGPDATTSPLTRPVVSADACLQSSVYRSPTRVSLLAPRAGCGNASPAEGNDRATATANWQPSLGATVAGSNSSPMISPRVMLEARMLTRAVRPSADALSSPLRPSGIIASIVAMAEPVTAGPQQMPPSDGGTSRVTAAHASPTGSLQQKPSWPQQLTPQPQAHCSRTDAANKTQPDLSTFPSPFASGNAASIVTSPRTSGTAGMPTSSSSLRTPVPASVPAAAPIRSPRTSGIVTVVASPPHSSAASLGLTSRRTSREQQHSAVSPFAASQPTSSLAFVRRTTVTQEVGLVGAEARSAPQSMAEEQPLLKMPRRTGDGLPVPVLREAPAGVAYASPVLLPQAPSEEDATLLKRLAAMDEAPASLTPPISVC